MWLGEVLAHAQLKHGGLLLPKWEGREVNILTWILVAVLVVVYFINKDQKKKNKQQG